jgi:hypothetical protein
MFYHPINYFQGCFASDHRPSQPGVRLPRAVRRLEPPRLPVGHRRRHSPLPGNPQEHGSLQTKINNLNRLYLDVMF